jgi:HEAT repeat protein
MAKGGITLLAVLFVAWVSCAPLSAGGPPGKEPLVQGKPLSYWLKELKDPDPLTREEALTVLAGAGEAARAAAPVLLELLKDKSAPVRVKAALALGQLKGHSKEATPVLLEAYKDGSRNLRQQILPALGPLALEVEDVLLLLLRASGDADDRTRMLASEGIRKAGPAAAEPLAKALDHADPVVRRQAVAHLANLGSAGKAAVPALTRKLKDDDWDTRFQAAQTLWRIDNQTRSILDVVVEASAKEDRATRQTGWALLVQIKPPAKEALAAYRAALKADTPFVRVQAADAVWHITRKADDVLPVYREVLENSTAANYPAMMQALTAVKQLGPEAKSLRVPLLEILKKGKDSLLIQSLPPVLARMGPDSIPTLAEVAGRVVPQFDQLEQTRSRAASRTLGLLGKDGLKPLIMLTEHQDRQVRIGAYAALQYIGPDAKDALPALRKGLKHEDSLDRSGAVWVLARLGPDAKEALPDLLEVARKDKDPWPRRYALAALPHLQPPVKDILPLLNDALDDRDPLVRLTAADYLWHLDPKDPRPVKIFADAMKEPKATPHALTMLVHRRDGAMPVYPAVTELLSHKNASYRWMAIQTLDQLGVGTKEHQQKLVVALGDPDITVRMSAAVALRRLGVEEKAAIDSLAKSLAGLPEFSQMLVLAVLAEFGPAAKDAIPTIERLMPAGRPAIVYVRWIEGLAAIDAAMVAKWKPTLEEAFDKFGSMSAARLLGQHYPKETKYVDFLVEKLQDSASDVNRFSAATTLANGGAWARQTVPALRQALEDSQPRVRIEAALALEKLEPKKHKIVPVLIEALRDKEDFNHRLQAIRALATLGPGALDAVPALRAAVRDPEGSVRFNANEALWKIDPKSAMPCLFLGN